MYNDNTNDISTIVKDILMRCDRCFLNHNILLIFEVVSDTPSKSEFSSPVTANALRCDNVIVHLLKLRISSLYNTYLVCVSSGAGVTKLTKTRIIILKRAKQALSKLKNANNK